MGKRRYWIGLLIFGVCIINYMDRVALSVAARPIAAEFGLSPVAMGYLFSSFLWTYAACLIPVGLLVDRIGTKTIIGGGLLLWSAATSFTGMGWNFGSILACRLLMGAGEATSYPGSGRVIRDWVPEGERGTFTALFNSGAVAGPAIGAVLMGWLVSTFQWRIAFVVLGGIGLVWLALWLIWFGQPERVTWLSARERDKILAERHGRDLDQVHEGATQSSLAHILSRPTMYGLMLSQACIVYNSYLFLTWLPTYLQTTLHLSTMNTGLFTAIPYGLSIILGLLIAWLSDRVLSPTAVRSGGRRYFVVAMMIMGMTVLAAPMAHDAVTLLVVMTVVLTATNTASGFNLTMVNDVAENPRDAARIMSLAVFGGNICGLLAPIVTGYVVSATGGFDWAFRIAAFLLVIGALVSILLSRGRVTAEHPHIAIGATAGATAG
ncbi:MAG TPA: MFS transporter [Rhodopila sp.]|nr:MFS transporter [Rhodopila sp.]